jgi:hypothetical protein
MQITKLAASLAAVMVTASLLAGARIGFAGTTMMTAPSSRTPTTTTSAVRAERVHADTRSGAGGEMTMPYYSYGASLPTFLKD